MGNIHAPELRSLVYSTNFQIRQIPAWNIFLGNINTFSIKPKQIINLFRSRYHRLATTKKLILPLGNYIETLKEHNFLGDVQFFKVQNNGVEIWYLTLPGAFPGKVIPDIDFKDKVVVQCVAPVVKILMQVPVIYK